MSKNAVKNTKMFEKNKACLDDMGEIERGELREAPAGGSCWEEREPKNSKNTGKNGENAEKCQKM